MTAAPIRVLIADDQPVVRDGLAMLLDQIEGVKVIGSAGDGLEAVEQAHSRRPDVVLMDLGMPGIDGIEATRRIRDALPDTCVLVLTGNSEYESVVPALKAGAHGYLTKGASWKEIEQAIRAVVAGETHLDPTVQEQLVAAVRDAPAAAAEPASAGDGLSPREEEVLKLIADGLSNGEIARTLAIGEATVESYVNRILLKTSSRDRAQAVSYAHRHGIG
jgi:DNA-binding NarL/FixJ family response regulator